MKKTLVPLMVFATTFTFAQIRNISVNISPNYPLINTSTGKATVITYLPASSDLVSYGYTQWSIKHTCKSKIGFDFNMKADYAITKRVFTSAGLSFNYLRYDQNLSLAPTEMDLQLTGNAGVPFGSFYGGGMLSQGQVFVGQPNAERTASYLSVPVMIGYSFLNDKLLVRTGPSVSLLQNATHYNVSYSAWGSLSQRKENSTDGYHLALVNLNTQVTYRVIKYLGIDFSYQQGLTPIYSDNTRSRFHTFTLGASYIFQFAAAN